MPVQVSGFRALLLLCGAVELCLVFVGSPSSATIYVVA